MFSLHESALQGYPRAGYDGFECFDLVSLARFVTQRVYSPIIWAGGSRGAVKFTAAYWCALDFDKTLTKQEACERLAGLRYVMGPTKSDNKEKVAKNGKVEPARDRFRVLVPFKRIIWERDLFEWNMKQMIRRFNADPLPYDGGRVWQTCTGIEKLELLGEALDVEDSVPVEETQAYKKEKITEYVERRTKQHALPLSVRRFVNGKIEASERNDALFKSACFLLQSGWTVEKVRDLVHSIPEMRDHDKIESTLKSAAKTTGALFF